MNLSHRRFVIDQNSANSQNRAKRNHPTVDILAKAANMRAGDFVPDVLDLQPADIILFYSGSSVGKIIQSYQRVSRYTNQASEVTHAAIFLDLDKICHARIELNPFRPGVEIESPFKVAKNRRFTVVRPDPPIRNNDERLVALRAAVKRGKAYAYDEIFFKILPSHLKSGRFQKANFADRIARFLEKVRRSEPIDPDQQEFSEGYICSYMVAKCYDEILRSANPLNAPGGILSPSILPAAFYDNSKLRDVNLSLRRVGP